MESGSDSELEAAFREYWQHTRQCINERLQFTYIYVVVVAAILVFIKEKEFLEPENLVLILLVVLFALVLSIIGFMVVIATSLGYEHYISDIVIIVYRWNKVEFYDHPKKPVHFANVHRMFFEFTVSLFFTLLLFVLSSKYDFLHLLREAFWFFIFFIIVFFAIETLYEFTWFDYFSESWQFNRLLKDDIRGFYRKDWNYWFKRTNFRRRILKDAEARRILKPKVQPPIKRLLLWILRKLAIMVLLP